jgi:hypothetical protein
VHAYYTQCRARVTVADGRCLLDHPIDMSTASVSSGRHVAARASRRLKRNPAPKPVPPATIVAPSAPPPPAATERMIDLTGLEEDWVAESLEAELLVAAHRSAPARSRITPAPVDPHPAILEEDDDEVRALEADLDPLMRDAPVRLQEIAPTGELIAALWARDSAQGAPAGWDGGHVDSALLDGRRVPRWTRTVVILAVALIGGWILGGVLMSEGPDPVETLGADASALAAALEDLNPVLDDLQDGSSDGVFVNGTLLSEVDSVARRLLASAAGVDAAAAGAARRLASDLAANALTVESTLGDLIGYGTGVARLTESPGFRPDAGQDEVESITADVVAWAASLTEVAAMLPDNRLVAEHSQAVERFVAQATIWQQQYLDAVRAGDLDQQTRLVEDLETELAGLAAGWMDTAAGAIHSIEAQIGTLQTEALDLTPRP